MPTRQTVPRLAYAVRSLWGFHVVYGGGAWEWADHMTIWVFTGLSEIFLQKRGCI